MRNRIVPIAMINACTRSKASLAVLVSVAAVTCPVGLTQSLGADAAAPGLSAKLRGRHRPVVAGGWTRIIEYPGHHLNDFCLFRAADGKWHAIGILGTGTWDSETSLFHSSGADLAGRFQNHPPVLVEAPSAEPLVLSKQPSHVPPLKGLMPQKHAPHVVVRNGIYHMFYRRPPGAILHVRGATPYQWDGLGDVIFEEEDARDPAVLQDGDRYIMYYCQLFNVDGVMRSTILARTSKNLESWSAPIAVHVDTARPAVHSYLESPFVVKRAEGYYLFICHRRFASSDRNAPPEKSTTVVLFSKDPMDFGKGERLWFQELHGVHAAELVEWQGRTYIARVGTDNGKERTGWVEIALIEWEPDTGR